jgi:hypothetical protein
MSSLSRETGAKRWHAGFALIELLVVVGIVMILLGLTLPMLSQARERGKVAVCLANCRQICVGFASYLRDQDDFRLPWYVRWGDKPPALAQGSAYGGFRAPEPHLAGWIPTDLRPLNPHVGVAPGTPGVIKTFVCPSDDGGYTWGIGHYSSVPANEAAWKAWGNSYPINLHWLEAILEKDRGWYEAIDDRGPDLLRRKMGAPASQFVIALEQRADASFAGSKPELHRSVATPLPGWHRRVNYYTLLYLDGHVAHEYTDARLSRGATWSLW